MSLRPVQALAVQGDADLLAAEGDHPGDRQQPQAAAGRRGYRPAAACGSNGITCVRSPRCPGANTPAATVIVLVTVTTAVLMAD
jgi:hypothetical protein